MLTKLRLNVRLLGVNRIPFIVSGTALLAGVAVVVFIRISLPPNYDPFRILQVLRVLSYGCLALWLSSLILIPLITGVLSARLTLQAYFSTAHAQLSLESSKLDRVL